ncbi:uncharacterized protein LOC135640902 isoform X2 [Musa acuminata AAA Group]|uniref:Regulator of Vps4 activity in the MVB pathway protein n=1 Tax=Musa acuminata subsp. malaccensis TaxID=214687 RepID=A0A804JK91_MUSAM|nr:PREDICTED: uncharacterized protein LOC103988932 [Musa acuminata subsp. malaccensis]
MGRKLDILLGRTSRQTSKLKTFLGLTVSRLAVLRNHRQVRRDQARGDVVQLLQLGHVDRALLRVEHVIKEQNMLDVFVMIEHYCHLLTERAPLLDRKECPEELREAISSLVFAASRCAELPELDKARGIFSSRYGKELVSAAVELRNNCCVDPKMIQKLSTRQPSLEIRHRVIKEIAAEIGIKLEFSESSETAEGNSMVSPPTHLNLEQLESDDNPAFRSHQKYDDVASAAQAAFESAAFAAAAARAAVELCRSESQEKGSADESKAGSQKRSDINGSESVEIENSADSKNFEKIHHDQNSGSDSDEGMKAKQDDLLHKERIRERFEMQLQRSSSSISDASDEDNAGSSEQHSAGFRGKNILFDESDNEEEKDRGLGTNLPYASHEELSPAGRIGYVVQAQRQFDASLDDSKPGKHQIYYRRNETRNSEMNNNSLHEETHKVGSRSGTESNYSTYNNAEKTYLDSSSTMRPLNLSSGKKPISVRTRRGL